MKPVLIKVCLFLFCIIVICMTLSLNIINYSNRKIVISSIPEVSAITSGSATITWTTNIPGDSQVFFRLAGDKNTGNTTMTDKSYSTSHSIILDGLLPDKTYIVRVKSSNEFGSSEKGEFSFSTKKALTIVTGPNVRNISSSDIELSWETNFECSYKIWYRTETSNVEVYQGLLPQKSFSVRLSNLLPDTKYIYSISCYSNYSTYRTKAKSNFFTTATPTNSMISKVYAVSLLGNRAIIYYETGTDCVTDMEVKSGSSIVALKKDKEPVKKHSFCINGLTAGKEYNYTILCNQINYRSDYYSFIYKAGSGKASLPAVKNISPTEVLLEWETDVDTSSKVFFSYPGQALQVLSCQDFYKKHRYLLTDLLPGTVYNYNIKMATKDSYHMAIDDLCFTTDTGNLKIVNGPKLTVLSPSELKIMWLTDNKCSSELYYWTNDTDMKKVGSSQSKREHSFILTDIIPGLDYSYKIENKRNDAVSNTGILSFNTMPDMKVINGGKKNED